MKKTKLFTAAVAMAMALGLAACSSSSESDSYTLSFEILNGKEGEVTIDNAGKDESTTSGALEVGEGEEILFGAELEKGKVLIQLQKSEQVEDLDTATPPAFDNPDHEITLEGDDIAHCAPLPGSYDVKVVMLDKTTGKITMNVQPTTVITETEGEEAGAAEGTATEETGEAGGHTNWTQAATAEEAAKGAGFDSMADLNGTVISLGELGKMGDITYRYMDGVVQEFCPAAAVEMSVIKGKVPAGDGDVSFDSTAYAHEWTQNVDGQEVKCFGNREGEATKTIWTDGEYNYAVLAYGAGGDDDYGLGAEDVAIMVNAVK